MMSASASMTASSLSLYRRLPQRSPYVHFSIGLTERQSHALRQESLRLGQSIAETLRGLLGPWADKRLKEFDAPKE